MKNSATLLGFGLAVLFGALYFHSLWITNYSGSNGQPYYYQPGQYPVKPPLDEFGQPMGQPVPDNNGPNNRFRRNNNGGPFIQPRDMNLTAQRMSLIRRQNPELADTIESLFRLKNQIRNNIDIYYQAENPTERNRLKQELNKLLSEEYDLEMKRNDLEIKNLEDRVQKLRESLRMKDQTKEDTVEKRLNELMLRPPPPRRLDPGERLLTPLGDPLDLGDFGDLEMTPYPQEIE